jgi:hypothetical protein
MSKDKGLAHPYMRNPEQKQLTKRVHLFSLVVCSV